MRKLAAILISVFYLTVTVGLAVNAHYCGGELESVGLYPGGDDCCCSGVAGHDSCCQNEVQVIALEDAQAPGSRLSIQPLAFDLPPAEDNPEDLLTRTGQPLSVSTPNLPPANVPAWLLFCSLVYYG